ncbi:diguanylate cyclase [Enterovibrio norvegicus]|uniref:bifunctional diguanylate cyclase/phosphodiesterase n=1 Tax=Enterovibrio norvegicus TaxID=188144 RepID=UPI000474FD89|nr:EAL domain-containing protein [Enterovibrio norvegicus]MCC4798401.1 EAL domain-containing protein [Enterovibrio norvegicus]OEE69134.1 diguanylate cyclase [Enterovibrio norvegicus]PMH65331.1 diguanylate cyclase [Enterovibrio norvegicus]PMI33223.1 diguanylate cyclase [Enterovibrio norvegicus]PMI33571.1 diguanylate cyclase [Enterovibrio norvegicus]
MTLYRQLFTWMLAIFFLLIIAVTGIELNTTRNFLLTQQTAEVNNTINSMGLALAPYLESDDKVATESVINALFDGGFYQEVRLRMLSDGSEIIRQYPVTVDGVPDWYIGLDLFPVITEERTFTSGWLQLAEVVVVSHPGFAYKEMWSATIQLGVWIGILFAIAMFIIGLQLSRSLRPLALITNRAKDIAQNKFGEPIPLPPTSELKTVVKAINQMSKQLEDYFEQQAKEADRLREHAYRDAVSGLGNRSFFVGQLKSWLAESAVGGLVMAKVDLITDTYQNQGFEKGDSLVSQFAKKLNTTITDADYTASRISKDEFVILAPNGTNEDMRMIGESLLAIVTDMQQDPMGISPPKVAIGLVVNGAGNRDASVLLAQADNALTQARNDPNHPISMLDQAANDSSMGRQQWKSLILDAIAHDWFVFKFQPASSSDKSVLHQEVFSAIERGDEYFGAAHFLGAVEQLELGESFDRYVVSHMIGKLIDDPKMGPIAINLTQSSVTDASFIRWLTSVMQKNRALAGRLFFEIPESVFVRYPDHVGLLTEQAHRFNFGFGVDNYGRNFQSLDYLNKFKPSYVKIDFAYTSNLDDEAQTHVLASICRTAHNLNITTIATRVETEAQLNKLSELFVNGFQGFIFEKKVEHHG